MNYIFFSSYNVNMLDIPPATQFDPKNWVFMVDLSKVASFTSPDPGTLHGLAIFVGFCFALLVFTETALNRLLIFINLFSPITFIAFLFPLVFKDHIKALI